MNTEPPARARKTSPPPERAPHRSEVFKPIERDIDHGGEVEHARERRQAEQEIHKSE